MAQNYGQKLIQNQYSHLLPEGHLGGLKRLEGKRMMSPNQEAIKAKEIRKQLGAEGVKSLDIIAGHVVERQVLTEVFHLEGTR